MPSKLRCDLDVHPWKQGKRAEDLMQFIGSFNFVQRRHGSSPWRTPDPLELSLFDEFTSPGRLGRFDGGEAVRIHVRRDVLLYVGKKFHS